MENITGMLEEACERLLGWVRHIRHVRGEEKRSGSNICEVYSIKKEYLEKEYVSLFLEERRKAAARNGCQIMYSCGYVSGDENEIGSVTLRCRGKLIDRAILTAGCDTGDGNRLIHWNFNTGKAL